MHEILVVFHVLVCLALIGFVLIQHGKGADAGAAFGSGASATVFGAQGSGNFLSRITAILATLFFLTSLTLAYFVGQRLEKSSVMDSLSLPMPPKKEEVVPAQTPPPTDLPPVSDLPPVQNSSPDSTVPKPAPLPNQGTNQSAPSAAPTAPPIQATPPAEAPVAPESTPSQ